VLHCITRLRVRVRDPKADNSDCKLLLNKRVIHKQIINVLVFFFLLQDSC